MGAVLTVPALVCLACWASLIRVQSFGRAVPVVVLCFVTGRMALATFDGADHWVALGVALVLAIAAVLISRDALRQVWPVLREMLPLRDNEG